MRGKILGIFVGTLLVSASPASAQQPAPLAMEADKDFRHAQTGLIFPATLQGLPRMSGTEFEPGGWDVAIQYSPSDTATAISVYVYQAAVQDVGLLIAESRNALEGRRSHYQNLQPLAPLAAFAPPGDAVKSGLRLTYSTDGQFKSTAIAIAPLGRDWVVKFRLSSKTMSAAELDTLLTSTITGLNWPKQAEAHAAAVEIAACQTPLPAMKPAKPVKTDMAYGLFGAIVNGVMEAPEDEAAGETVTAKAKNPTVYCRDTSLNFPLGLYRPNNATDRYLLSLGDSGRAILVDPDASAFLTAVVEKKKAVTDQYSVRFIGPGKISNYQPHKGMIPPDQAWEIVSKTAPLSSSGRGDGDKTIQINTR
jgi:hypothetical protein